MDIPYNNLVSIANDEDKTRRLKQSPEVQGPALPANFQQPEHIIYANITVDNPLAGYNNSGIGPQQAQPTYQQPTVGGNHATQATPEKWYAGDSPTYAEMVAQLYRKKDSLSPEQYNTLAAQIDALKDDPTSGFYYNRYANGPTSPFIEEIAKLGVDVSGGINDEWIAKNQYLLQGARYTDTGTTPAAPTKTSTKEQNLAYYFYQIARNYNDTKEVLQEEDALKKEISYWVGRDDLNLSDDQILEKLDWTKKYKYLQGLKDAATPGTSTTGKQYNYTQAIDYNPDHLRAYIWQARNNGGTGNIELDAVSAALGQGNTWKENKALAAKMNPLDPANYSPYSVASTMEEEAALFGVKQFDQDWIDQNRALAYSADAATRNAYANVVKNEPFTQKAETERKMLYESVDTMLAAGLKPDEIMDGILDDYPSLKKLEDSLYSGKGLVETTRPIDFRLQDVKNMVEQEYAKEQAKTKAVDFGADITQILNTDNGASATPTESPAPDTKAVGTPAGSKPKSTAAPSPILSPAEIAVNLSKDKTLAAAASTLLVTGTEPEKTVMKFAPSIQFPGLLPILAQNIATGTLSGNAGRDFVQKQTDDYTAKNYLSSKKVTDQHDTIQKQQDEMKKEKADLQRVVDLADRANELEALSPYKNPWTPWTIKEINGQVYSLSADYNEKTGKFDVNVSREAASDFNADIDAVAQKAAEEYLSELNTGVHVKSVDENGEAEYDLGNSLAPKPATRNIAIRADQDLYYVSTLRLQENGEYALGPVARVTQGKDVIPSSFKLIDAWENSPIDADTQKQIDAWARDLGDFSGYAGENGAQIPTLDEADAARAQIKFLNSRIKETQKKLDTMQPEYTRAQEQQKLIKNGAQTAALLDIMNNAPKIDASGFYGHLRMQEQIQAYTDKAMELPRSLDLISKVGSEYRPTEWRAQTIFDELSAMGTSPAEVQEFTYGLIHQSQANLDALNQSITRAENAGVELDADTKSNLEREKNRLQKEKQDAQDYALRYRSDFDSKVEDISADVLAHPEKYKGTFALYAVDPARDEPKVNNGYWISPAGQYTLTPQQPEKASRMDELTPEERKTYLYKVSKEGPRAAYAYYDSCVDRAQVRKAIGEQEELAQFAKDYPVLATLSSIMISPASGEGYLYSLASLAAGQDINPYSQFFFNTRAEQTLVSNAREKILSGLDKNSIGYEVAGLVFDGVVSGAKSGVNAALTGPLFGWIGGAAGTFASVAPMALGAGSAGVLDVNARGGKDWQSVLTGAFKAATEAVTEAFTTQNISEAISAGATGVKGFFKKVLGSDLVEETVGETLGDTIDYFSDDWINGKISERQLAIEEYKKTMSDEDAVAAANMDFAKGLLRTAATTLVSTGMTSGGSYAAGYASYVADQLSMSQARHTPEAVADAALSQARHTPDAVAATARRVSALTASLNADATSQSAAIGAVLMPDNATDTDIRTAGAAGIQLSAMLGQQQAVDVVRQVMADASIASEADTDLTEEARAALSVAALGKGEAARVVQEIAETGITGGDTQRLIEAANRDMANPEVERRINQAVRDVRIALRSQELIADGALAGIRPYEAAVKQERAKLREAQARLQDAVEQQRAAGQNLRDTHEQYKADPGNENLRGAVRRATQDVVNQKKVVGENAQSVQNIEESMKRAEADLENVRDTAMKDVRQQAVADVQAEEQAEAQEAAEAAAQEANATPDRNPNAGTIYTNDQIPVSFHYSLVPVSDLVTSNTDTGEANSAYPAELQPRDRTRQASQDQVAGMVRTLNPARLGESADVQNGAPIVGPDNVVESGNARTMAIRQAMANNPESAARYTQYLRENAARFGLNPEDVTENSVLVRVRDTDLDRVAFARAANESTTAGYSPSENAQGDAAKLTPRMMELFAPSDTGRLDTTDNHSFVLAFIEDVIPESERGAYMQSDGTISQQGYERIRNAVFQRAYGSTALTQILTEDTDGSSRNVMNALLKAAPRMMALQDAVDQGGVYDVGLAQKIAEAAQRYMQLKNAGMSVNTYLDQIAIPGMQTEDAATQSLMRLFEEYRRSGKKLSEALTNIADAVEDAGDPRAVSFLGQTEAPPLTELIRQGVERMLRPRTDGVSAYRVNGAKVSPSLTPQQQQAQRQEQNRNNQQGQNVVSPQETIRQLTDALGITRDARVRKYLRHLRNITAGYTMNNSIIHTRNFQDARVAMHEIGHNLDVRLGLQDMVNQMGPMAMGRLAQDYAANIDPNFLLNYTPQEIPDELMAEFSCIWAMDRDQAVNLAGEDFVNQYERALQDHGWLRPMQTAAEQMRQWADASNINRAESTVRLETPRTNKDKITLNKTRSIIADHTLPLEEVESLVAREIGQNRFSQNARELLLFRPTGVSNATNVSLYDTMIDPYGDTVHRADGTDYGSLSDILHNIDKRNEKAFNTYLLARLDSTRRPRGRGLFSNDIDSADLIRQYEEQYPNFKDIADRVYDWYNKFVEVWLVDTGIVPREQFNTMRRVDPYYVPLHAADESVDRPSGRQRTDGNPANVMERSFESDVSKYNPVMGLVENVQKYIMKAKTIEALRAFDSHMMYALENHLDVGNIAEPAQPDMERIDQRRAKRNISAAQSQTMQGLQGTGDITQAGMQAVLDAIDSIGDFEYIVDRTASGQDVINIPMPDGSIHSWTIYSPELLQALTMTDSNGNINPVVRKIINGFSTITRALSANVTSRNLKFSVQNVFSDVETAATTGRTGHNNVMVDILAGARPYHMAKEIVAGFDLLRNKFAESALGERMGLETSERYNMFKRFGMLGSRYAFRDTKTQKETRNALYGGHRSFGEAILAVAKSPLNFVEAVTGFGEEMTRYNAFALSGFDLSTYEGRLQAAKANREATTDFSKFGSGSDSEAFKVAKAAIPFLNAQIQGIDKTLDTLHEIRNDPRRRAVLLGRVAVNSIIMGAVTAAFRNIVWGDDEKEGYEDLTDYEKTKFIHLWRWPDGTWFKMKRSQDMAVQAADLLGEYIGEVSTGYEGDAFADLANGAVEIVKNGMLSTDTSLQPFFDALNNKTWYGSDIDTYSDKKMSPTARYGVDTSKFARVVSILFGGTVHPKAVDYAVKQFLGSAGTLGTALLDTAVSSWNDKGFNGQALMSFVKNEVIGGYIVDPVYSNKVATTFYDGKERMDYMVEEIKKGRAPEQFRSNLTQDESNAAAMQLNAMMDKGGIVYEANQKYSDLKKEYEKVMGDDTTLTPVQQAEKARELKHQMNVTLLEANAAMGDFFREYGYNSVFDQAIMNTMNVLADDKNKAIPDSAGGKTDYDAMYQTFKDDEGEAYMQMSKSVYDATGNRSALPHPQMTFTKSGTEYQIDQADQDTFISLYKASYKKYVAKNSKNWNSMTDEERLKVLTQAHDAGRDTAKAWYMKKHKIK